MNFEFMRKIDGLNKAYNSCKNAEDLALTKPDCSLFAARKSGETIAKYIYLIAHSKIAKGSSFADILDDEVFRKYLKDQRVLNAFYYVKNNGNTAVHTNKDFSSKEAVTVLRKLHFVVGEVAKKMRRIVKYPIFNPNLEVVPKATLDPTLEDIEAADKMAKEMYKEYILSQDRANRFFEEFDELAAPQHCTFLPGTVELNETIEFDHKPKLKMTISRIQEHFGFLALKTQRYIAGLDTDIELHFFAEITLYGEQQYTASDLVGFVRGLRNLPNADGFKISTSYYGPSVDPWFNSDVKDEFSHQIEQFGEQDGFKYTAFEFLHNHGGGRCLKYENGKWFDPEKECSEDIINVKRASGWWTWSFILGVDFDFDKHADILEALRNVVRKYIPADEFVYSEKAWEEGEQEVLLADTQWNVPSLSVVKEFLDEINNTLTPIMGDCTCYPEGTWYITEAPFAIAAIEWTDKGLVIRGSEL